MDQEAHIFTCNCINYHVLGLLQEFALNIHGMYDVKVSPIHDFLYFYIP